MRNLVIGRKRTGPISTYVIGGIRVLADKRGMPVAGPPEISHYEVVDYRTNSTG